MDYLSSLVTKPEMEILIDGIDGRKKYAFKTKKGEVRMTTYHDRETVTGKLVINLKSAKKLEHSGIKLELVGCLEHLQDKKNVSRFIALTRDLEPPGVITNEKTQLEFKFNNVDMQYESYLGSNMQVR
jgi:vacuolar protein sorting-associated protein 26